MSKVSQPELKRFLDKNVLINIQGGRKIKGNLRGYDLFLNIVVDEAVEQVQAENNQHLWIDGARCGTVVCLTLKMYTNSYQVIRGNSVNSLEGLESINTR
jgi:small nuclear ribonucleoprotein G